MTQRGVFEKIPGSGVWYVHYYDAGGKRRREKAGTKANAIALYHKRKAEALAGRKLPERLRQRPVLFRAIAEDALAYSRAHKRSHRDDEYRMHRLREWFGEQKAAEITPQEIERKLEEMAADRTPGTVNRHRALLSLIYRLAVRNGKVPANPVRSVPRRKENNCRVRFLDENEEFAIRAKIRELCPEREPEFDLALHSGMRRNEQHRLRWQDVDLARGIITILHSKHGEKRHIPINSIAQAVLRTLLGHTNGLPYVCPGRDGERDRDWERWFERCVREAKVPDFHWHDLRHTFASRLVMAGVDLRTVQELLGHKSILMTMRYAHLAPAHLRDAVERLAGESTATRTATNVARPATQAPAYVN
jgi:integrase